MKPLLKNSGFGAIDAMIGGALIFGISYAAISGFKKNLSMRSEIYVDGYAANFENEVVSNLHDIFDRWIEKKTKDSSGCKTSYNGEFQAIAADPQPNASGIRYRLVTDRSQMYDVNTSDPVYTEVKSFVWDVFCTTCLWGQSGSGPLRGVFQLLLDQSRSSSAVQSFINENGPVYVAILQNRLENEWREETYLCSANDYNTKGSFDILKYTIIWKNKGKYKKISGLKHLYPENFINGEQRLDRSLGLLDDSLGQFFINANEDSKAERTLLNLFSNTSDTITPIAGNWTGATGGGTVGYYSASTQKFHLLAPLSSESQPTPTTVAIANANASWKPLAGDWLDDSADEVALYDSETGEFRIYDLQGAEKRQFVSPCVGTNSIPLAGNWDGTGKDGIGFYNPETHQAFLIIDINDSTCPEPTNYVGVETDWIPVVGAWDRPKILNEKIAFYSPSKGKFYFPIPIQITADASTPGAIQQPGTPVTYYIVQDAYTENNALAFGPSSSSMKPFAGGW